MIRVFGRSSGMENEPIAASPPGQRVAGMNTQQKTSTIPRRVILTVNGASRLSYVTPVPAPPARQQLFTLLPKRFMTSSKRQVVRMSLSVIIGFVACWLPYFVVSLVRIFTDYGVRLSGLLSASELLALAHSALNPLIYGLFSARTLRHSCGQRCQRRRSRVACDGRTPSRCGTLSPCCCCCCQRMVADVSPDVAAGAVPSPLVLLPDTAQVQRHQPLIELQDLAFVASTAARSCRHRGQSAADGRPTSADSSTTDTTDDLCRRTSASTEFQRGSTATHGRRSRRAHLQLTDHVTTARLTMSAAAITDHHSPVSDPIVRADRAVTLLPTTSTYNRQSR